MLKQDEIEATCMLLDIYTTLGASLYVMDLYAKILPQHNRSLNFYKGFRKVDSDRWEFANNRFLRGQKHLLKDIKRRKPPSHSPFEQQSLSPFLEVGHFGLEGEVERLKSDKSILMAELVKLRKEQQNTQALLRAIEDRILGTEQKQQQMMAFLAQALRRPDFLQQLVQQKDIKKELEEAISKKRRRPIDRRADPGDSGGITDDDNTLQTQLKVDEGFEGIYGYEVPELESLALEIHGFGRVKEEEDEQKGETEGKADELMNNDFWEELLN